MRHVPWRCMFIDLHHEHVPDLSSLLQAVPGTMWTFEQMQTLGFSSVATVVRMTVIKLSSGGLWVHAPIAPTRHALCAWPPASSHASCCLLAECCRM